MKKTEILKGLASASNANRIESLTSQIETLKASKARSAEELALLIEPLALSLANLTDEARSTLESIQNKAEAQSKMLTDQVKAARQAASLIQKVAQTQNLKVWGIALVIGVTSSLLVSGLLRWAFPPPLISNSVNLDSAQVADILLPYLVQQPPQSPSLTAPLPPSKNR
jgi:hypothetical protein